MLELVVLGIFSVILLTCIALDVSILYALLLGYAVFFVYGRIKKHTTMQIIRMSLSGVKTIQNILLTFVLIGMITAVWRDCGTIPYIIYHFSKIITPSAFLLTSFLLCCLLSVLTGTSFGTVATVGVICMTLANAMQINPLYIGGAILSGIYFGDRCSPMSTSALLVCELTETDIYRNIKNMIRTSLVPFALTCILYIILGVRRAETDVSTEIWGIYERNFNLGWVTVLPAVLLIILCLCRVKVKTAMAASIVAGSVVSLLAQSTPVLKLLQVLATGFHAPDPQLAALMDGGGITSNIRVIVILCISSTYAGIFEETGMLDGIKARIVLLSEKTSPYASLLVSSVLANMVACNQTLSTMIVHNLFKDITTDNERLAVDMENTVVVIAPLIPWCVAGAVPLATIGAPTSCLLLAFYLYLLPLWNLFTQNTALPRRRTSVAKARSS